MVIYLQKASTAKRVYATVVNAKTNTDGNKVQGITFPSGEMQKKLIKEVYAEVGVNPADVVYVEAHGTGTKVSQFPCIKLFMNGHEVGNLMLRLYIIFDPSNGYFPYLLTLLQ